MHLRDLILFAFLVLSPFRISIVDAQNDDVVLTDDGDEPIGDTIMSDSEDVVTEPHYALDKETARLTWMLADPESIDKIAFNRPVKFVVNMINEAKRRQYKFHKISASFRYPADPKYVLFNISAMNYETIVMPGEIQTFAYEFRLMDEYTARSVIIILTALYSDDLHRSYDETLVNRTILILESEQTFDLEMLFLYITLIALGSAIVFGVYQFVKRKLKNAGITVHHHTKRDTLSGSVISKHDVDMSWIDKQHLKNQDKNHERIRKEARKRTSNHATTSMMSESSDSADKAAMETAKTKKKSTKSIINGKSK